MTYMLPGYTEYYEEDGVLYISSKLLQNKVKITEAKLREEFYEILRCGGCDALSTPLTQFLHEQELLADQDEIKKLLQYAKRVMGETLFLTIMPTEGCNFRCPYCYETHTPITMRRETLDQIQRYVIGQVPRFRNIHLNWFGGEPTLCKDIILETCALVQEVQATHAFRYSGGMTTNGYLLDADAFRQYYAAGITNYQVTLDGWKHDETRPHVSGKGTLQTILNNLIALSGLPKERYLFRMVIRHNILAGDRDFSWYDHLYDLFGGDDRFSVYVSPVGDWGGESVRTLELLDGEQKAGLPMEHLAYLDRIGMRRENQDKEPFAQVCYASYPHSMIFRASGKIEKCTVALDHPKNLLGWVDPEKGIVLDEAINRLWSSDQLKQGCYTCPEVLSCFNLRCRKGILVDGDYAGSCLRA